MATHVEHSRLHQVPNTNRVYSPDILPRLQTILADLADIDIAFEKSLEAVKHCPDDEERKSEMIAGLWRQHREQRAPYIQELIALRERIETTFI
jgi:DNA-binding transcriptional MerR regulator